MARYPVGVAMAVSGDAHTVTPFPGGQVPFTSGGTQLMVRTVPKDSQQMVPPVQQEVSQHSTPMAGRQSVGHAKLRQVPPTQTGPAEPEAEQLVAHLPQWVRSFWRLTHVLLQHERPWPAQVVQE